MVKPEEHIHGRSQRIKQLRLRETTDQQPTPPVPIHLMLNETLKSICEENQKRKQFETHQTAQITQHVRGNGELHPEPLPPYWTDPESIRVCGEGGCFRKLLAATTYRWYYTYNKLNSNNEEVKHQTRMNLLYLVEGANPLYYRKCLEDQALIARANPGTLRTSPRQLFDNIHPTLAKFFALDRFRVLDTPQGTGRVDVLVNSVQKKYKPLNKPRNPLLDVLGKISDLNDVTFDPDLLDRSNVALPTLKNAAPLVFQMYLSFLGRDSIHQDGNITHQQHSLMGLLSSPPSVVKGALSETALGWLDFMLRALHIEQQNAPVPDVPEDTADLPTEDLSVPFEKINGDFHYFLDLGVDFQALKKHVALQWDFHCVLQVFEQSDFRVFDPTANHPEMLEKYKLLARMVRQLTHALEMLPEILTHLNPDLHQNPFAQLGEQLLKNVTLERKALP